MIPATQKTQSSRLVRTGAAFLVLVVLVLLLVVGATQTLVRSELTSRRSESDRMRLRSMLAAVEHAQQLELRPDESVQLPTDDAVGQYIEVTLHEDGSRISARWMKDDVAVVELHRTIEKKTTEPNP